MTKKELHIIIDEVGPKLLQYADIQIRNIEAAKDLVQECFIVLIEKKEQVPVKKAQAFLFAVLRNKILDYYKSIKYEEGISEQNGGQTSGQNKKDILEIVHLGLGQLKPLYRQLITLKDLEGYNYEEIGSLTNLSKSQVKVYLFRARKQLKEALIIIEMKQENEY